MKASQLRDLTRKYAGGKLGREEYLAERTRLIDGIVAGDIELHYRDLEPGLPRRAPAQKHWLMTAGSIMLVGLLVIALLAYFIDDNTNSDDHGETTMQSAVKNPGTARLDAFINSGDWSESSLAQLEKDWNALSVFHQENARRSASFQRLKYETGQRITEQEALLAAGKMEALLQVSRLRKFAERLGIRTER